MKQEHSEDSSDNPVLYNCQSTGWAGSKVIYLLLALSLATVPIYLTKNNKTSSQTWGSLIYIVYSFPTGFWLPFSYQYCLVLPQIVTQTCLKSPNMDLNQTKMLHFAPRLMLLMLWL